jgi:hypothetical protein
MRRRSSYVHICLEARVKHHLCCLRYWAANTGCGGRAGQSEAAIAPQIISPPFSDALQISDKHSYSALSRDVRCAAMGWEARPCRLRPVRELKRREASRGMLFLPIASRQLRRATLFMIVMALDVSMVVAELVLWMICAICTCCVGRTVKHLRTQPPTCAVCYSLAFPACQQTDCITPLRCNWMYVCQLGTKCGSCAKSEQLDVNALSVLLAGVECQLDVQ